MNGLSPNIEHLREKAAALPRQPGVYIMKNAAGKVIYVGKSRSLRDRVSQYFHGAHDPKTTRMAASVHDFRFITCDTEMEALALENSLSKQYTPKYNIKLKYAKSYPYIRIGTPEKGDGEEWPRISMSRKRSISARYSGFITDARRPALALRATAPTAFRLPLFTGFAMSFLIHTSFKDIMP